MAPDKSSATIEALQMTNPAGAGFACFKATTTEAMFVTWLAHQANGTKAH
jgi:hypothetical protein